MGRRFVEGSEDLARPLCRGSVVAACLDPDYDLLRVRCRRLEPRCSRQPGMLHDDVGGFRTGLLSRDVDGQRVVWQSARVRQWPQESQSTGDRGGGDRHPGCPRDRVRLRRGEGGKAERPLRVRAVAAHRIQQLGRTSALLSTLVQDGEVGRLAGADNLERQVVQPRPDVLIRRSNPELLAERLSAWAGFLPVISKPRPGR